MRRFAFAILAVAFGTVTASAADMPVKALPAPAPILNWTGFYVGANGGGIWSHNNVSSSFR